MSSDQSSVDDSGITQVEKDLSYFEEELKRTGLDQIILFNRVYLIITQNVRRRLKEFQYPDFLNEFDTTFAKYYIKAVQSLIEQKQPSKPWAIALKGSSKADRRHPIAKLALGVNAHITNDIALSLYDVHAEEKHRRDYNHVNKIIYNSAEEILSILPYSWCRWRILRLPIISTMWIITVLWRSIAWRNFKRLQREDINSKELNDETGKRAKKLNKIPL